MSDASPFRYRDYRAFWAARLASTIGNTMLVVVIGIHVYDIARGMGMSIEAASFWLGMIGIAQFLPLFLLTLVAGYVADRLDRRWIVRVFIGVEMLCAAALGPFSYARRIYRRATSTRWRCKCGSSPRHMGRGC